MINNQVQRTTLTMKEASEYLGISYWLINQLVRKKQIPYCKVGGKYLFRVQALDEDVNLFANRKIQILLKEPDGDTYIRVWLQLLILAMECNKEGNLLISDNKPMTIEYFSKIMGKSEEKMQGIINKFLELDMITLDSNVYKIKNWNEYQSIETYEKYKEQARLRQQKYREKKKSENEKSDVTVTLCNGEEKKNEEIRIKNKEDKKKEIRKEEENTNGFRKYEM